MIHQPGPMDLASRNQATRVMTGKTMVIVLLELSPTDVTIATNVSDSRRDHAKLPMEFAGIICLERPSAHPTQILVQDHSAVSISVVSIPATVLRVSLVVVGATNIVFYVVIVPLTTARKFVLLTHQVLRRILPLHRREKETLRLRRRNRSRRDCD